MKILKSFSAKILTMIVFIFASAVTFAQDKDIDLDISVDKGGEDWYMQPWVWVVAGAVFILLLVAMLRGGKKA